MPKTARRKARDGRNLQETGEPTPSSREPVEGTDVDGPPRVYKIGMPGIGTVALAWINGYVYTGIGQRVKNESQLHHCRLKPNAA
jgi:hypothetical protein